MNLLLDTCTFLWVVLEPARLSAHVTRLVADPGNTVFLSTVSAWEIAVVYALGRVTLQQPAEIFVPTQRQNHGIDLLPLSEAAALYVPNMPPIHRDPFDRMLICQAIVHDLVLLTPDPLIRQYPQVRTEW